MALSSYLLSYRYQENLYFSHGIWKVEFINIAFEQLTDLLLHFLMASGSILYISQINTNNVSEIFP